MHPRPLWLWCCLPGGEPQDCLRVSHGIYWQPTCALHTSGSLWSGLQLPREPCLPLKQHLWLPTQLRPHWRILHPDEQELHDDEPVLPERGLHLCRPAGGILCLPTWLRAPAQRGVRRCQRVCHHSRPLCTGSEMRQPARKLRLCLSSWHRGRSIHRWMQTD